MESARCLIVGPSTPAQRTTLGRISFLSVLIAPMKHALRRRAALLMLAILFPTVALAAPRAYRCSGSFWGNCLVTWGAADEDSYWMISTCGGSTSYLSGPGNLPTYGCNQI